MSSTATDWSTDVFREMKSRDIATVCTVPDGGLTQLLKMIEAERQMRLVTLSTEEEGIGIATGCWLGGSRAMIAMQSSGVGNCINMLSLPVTCRMPFLTLITMRGEWAEFNPWQVPMSQAVEPVLAATGVKVYRVDSADEVADTAQAAADLAFGGDLAVAVLLSQKMIGRKVWVK